jgi:hypothetical protein
MEVLAARVANRDRNLNATLAGVLRAGDLFEGGVSAADLSLRMQQLGLLGGDQRLDQPLEQLRQLGYVEREEQPRAPIRGSTPALWRLTERGSERRAQLTAAKLNILDP